MAFLSPAFLWTLLALLPLAAIYFLKVRPRKKTTTAWFLWEKVFTEKKASSLFNRLRDLFSLLLMALAFAAIAFALAKPEFSGDERKDLLLLIDQSASMEATHSSGKSNLDLAKEEAANIVIAMNGNQRAAVATIGDGVVYRSHFTTSPKALLESIDRIEPTDFPFPENSLSTLTEALTNQSNAYRAILLTDGHFRNDETVAADRIEVIKVGSPLENVGIVAADLQTLPGGPLGFYFRLNSTFPETVEADLVLKNLDVDPDRVIKLIPLTVQPGLNPPEIFEIEESLPGRWTATIEVEDALAKDNTAYLTIPESQPVRIAVGTENRYFFETSILAFEASTGVFALVGESEEPDLVIEQRTALADSENSLIFTPDGEASPWWSEPGETLDVFAPRVLIPEHPALRYTDLSSIPFPGARELKAPENAVILVESETGVPLVYKVSNEEKTAIIVNLDPVQADFYFSTWFPALVHSAAKHLAGREESTAPLYQPGDSAPIPGASEGVITTVVQSDASAISGESMTVSTDTLPIPELGFYEMKNESGTWPVASSLISQTESLLSSAIADTSQPISRGRAPAHWLLLFAALVFTLESILYHRRKLG